MTYVKDRLYVHNFSKLIFIKLIKRNVILEMGCMRWDDHKLLEVLDYFEKMKIFKAIKSTLCQFANVTTIHGVAYVFDRTIQALDNLLWFISVCVGTGLAIHMSLDAWKTWKESPVLTSVRSTGLPLQNVDFPAITICSQGLIKVCKFLEEWH